MGYFPFFVDLEQKNGLIIGGGTIALRKIKKLLPYGPRLTVAAPDICAEIIKIPGLVLHRHSFTPELLDGMAFVIAATDDCRINRRISQACQARRILVNVVDGREDCAFLFPALVKQGSLSIGISTGGASPSAAIYLKEQIRPLVPENFGELLEYLDALRDEVKAALPDERQRAACFSRIFAICMQTEWPLSQMEFREILLSCLKDTEECT